MVSARATACPLVWLMVSACSFDSGGSMGGASAEIGDIPHEDGDDGATSEGSGAETNASATGSHDDAPDDAASSDDDTMVEESGGSIGHPAVLSFVEAPAYDFTLVPLGTSLAHVVTLHNTGGQDATGITAAVAVPFGFQGGAWPGTGGTCLDTLAPDGFCQIELAFSPPTLGPVGGTIVVDYDNGEAPGQVVLSLAGTGSGSTPNLLVNGDGETSGNPPPQWIEAIGSGWTTTTYYQRNGARSITAGDAPNGEMVLYQAVDVSPWLALVDAGTLRIAFDGWSRTYGASNDVHFYRVDFLDGNGTALQTFQGVTHTSVVWEETADVRAAPGGTRAVVVGLHCSKNSGTSCDAFFDDMSLVASYP